MSRTELNRTDLLKELDRLRAILRSDPRLEAVTHDLDVHREELETQNRQLLDSQHQLEAARDRYAELFDFAPLPYVLLNNSAVIQDINLAAAELLGAERSRLIGFPFNGFIDSADRRRFLDHIAACRRTPGSVDVDLLMTSRSGRRMAVHMTTKQWHSMHSGVIDFHMALVDLTERKAAETERLRAAREHQEVINREHVARAANEAKDRFLAVLSHELRTPLTPILFALAAAERAGAIPASIAPTVGMIKRNIELEARLIDDLLDITRITRGKLRLATELVDLHQVVHEAIDLSQEEIAAAGLSVSTNLAACDRHVQGDGARLLQVLRNLLSNAIRHTPRDGRIMIGSANPRTGRVEIRVRDSGTGMVSDVLERLFRPFEQGVERSGRGGGLGLGLAISRGIMEAHGGSIAAHSEGPGRGATFVVTLQSVAGDGVGEPHEDGRRATRAAQPSSTAKILLVEDNHDNASAIAALLRVEGYAVELADSVADALRRAASGFDILVSDIGLPDGSGRELMRKLCAGRPVRGIALTGYGTDEDVRLDAEAGFAAHLTKPVDPDKLIALLAEFARHPPMRRESRTSPGRAVRARRRRSG